MEVWRHWSLQCQHNRGKYVNLRFGKSSGTNLHCITLNVAINGYKSSLFKMQTCEKKRKKTPCCTVRGTEQFAMCSYKKIIKFRVATITSIRVSHNTLVYFSITECVVVNSQSATLSHCASVPELYPSQINIKGIIIHFFIQLQSIPGSAFFI